MADEKETCEGGCACGHVRYEMTSLPLIVHCCHCTWCQRQTGSAFAVNALIEADRVHLAKGEVLTLKCPRRVVRTRESRAIFTSSKQPWVTLPPDALAVDDYYVTEEVWPEESLERRAALMELAKG